MDAMEWRALVVHRHPTGGVGMENAMTEATDNVSVAPQVLTNLIAMAVREVPGIAQIGGGPRSAANLRGDGVTLRIEPAGVSADCHLIARYDSNLLDLGIAVQATIAAVIQELAGMTVREVNVYIQDVEAGRG